MPNAILFDCVEEAVENHDLLSRTIATALLARVRMGRFDRFSPLLLTQRQISTCSLVSIRPGYVLGTVKAYPFTG